MNPVKSLKKRAINALGRNNTRRKEREDNYQNIDYLLDLIQAREWRDVRKVIKSKYGKVVCNKVDDTGLTAFGAAVGCSAPLDITIKILNFWPEALNVVDNHGSTPLHFACLNNVSNVVIDFVIKRSGGRLAVLAQDNMGFTPLHHAVLSLCVLINDTGSSSASPTRTMPSGWQNIIPSDTMSVINGVNVIERLCEEAPECIYILSNQGYSPIEFIQDKRASILEKENLDLLNDIYYNILREHGIRYYKHQKKMSEEKGWTERSISKIANYGENKSINSVSASIILENMTHESTNPSCCSGSIESKN